MNSPDGSTLQSGPQRQAGPRRLLVGMAILLVLFATVAVTLRRLAGDTARAASTDDVTGLRQEAAALNEVVADLILENRLLKKSMMADGGEDE